MQIYTGSRAKQCADKFFVFICYNGTSKRKMPEVTLARYSGSFSGLLFNFFFNGNTVQRLENGYGCSGITLTLICIYPVVWYVVNLEFLSLLCRYHCINARPYHQAHHTACIFFGGLRQTTGYLGSCPYHLKIPKNLRKI